MFVCDHAWCCFSYIRVHQTVWLSHFPNAECYCTKWFFSFQFPAVQCTRLMERMVIINNVMVV